MLAGTLAPWVDPETVGPFRPLGDYAYAYGVLRTDGLFS
jgi:hypothetical protein